MKPNDTFIIIGYNHFTKKDKKAFAELAKKVQANLITFETPRNQHWNLGTQTIKDLEGYSLLASGWNLLRKIAHRMGRDIDHPHVIQKYRGK